MPRPTGSGPLGLRLALAFVAVALLAVALLAGLTAVFAASDVSSLTARQRADLTKAMTAVAVSAWDHNDGWRDADLGPALAVSRQIGLDVEVVDNAGRVVAATPAFSRGPVPVPMVPLIVRGQKVGSIAVRLTGKGLPAAGGVLRSALWRAIAGAAGLAALLALLAGLLVARRITRPVSRLIEVTHAMGHGDRSARVGEIRAPDELRELAATFDRMADNLVRQDQLRREVVADVAHELRTPVAVLQAGHEALLDGVIEPSAGQLSSLRDEVLRLARLVDDLHTLAAAEASALQLSLQPCDLAEITEAGITSLEARYDAAGVTLERWLTPVGIRADARRMHQVVTNLLSNALKFTPAGGRVTVETGPDGPRARLCVADTGIGIPGDEQPRIFDRFWRGQQASGVAGSGIGLAVVAELVRAHGGRVTVASGPGRGTQMIVTLPRADR